ncbi:MAG: hypothetical protein IMF06_11305 [Proteobacteria bacterium]|nr:hypothetical protein [Pseudomonadota bacterium]
MNRQSIDVIVLGGGPAGTTTALAHELQEYLPSLVNMNRRQLALVIGWLMKYGLVATTPAWET